MKDDAFLKALERSVGDKSFNACQAQIVYMEDWCLYLTKYWRYDIDIY